jgi:murein DD-endopeptidase MepM/ murein hydrolase activator NlpD
MRWLFLLILLFPAQALAGVLTLEPPVVDNGGVALLHWHGAPPSEAVARFNNRFYNLRSTPKGMLALLGTDLELTPGSYPVEVTVVNPRGEAESFHLRLEVRQAVRPEERLTLPPAKVTPSDPAVLKRIEKERALLADLFSRQQTPPLWDSFVHPVSDPVGSPFGLRRILNGQPKSPHAGVDFRSPAGTPVRTAASGKVAFAGDLFYTGMTVIIDHGEGLFSLYAHLQTIDCSPGEVLDAGTVLGRVGSTGRSTGPHLHWGVKLRGDRVDPLALTELLGGEKR